jgi:hypothetical protein
MQINHRMDQIEAEIEEPPKGNLKPFGGFI